MRSFCFFFSHVSATRLYTLASIQCLRSSISHTASCLLAYFFSVPSPRPVSSRVSSLRCEYMCIRYPTLHGCSFLSLTHKPNPGEFLKAYPVSLSKCIHRKSLVVRSLVSIEMLPLSSNKTKPKHQKAPPCPCD